MRLRQLLTLVAASAALTATARATPVQWPVAAGGNGHWYEAFIETNGISWDAAQLRALSLGGYLATATSSAENEFLFGLINAPEYWQSNAAYSAGAWLGGYQATGAAEPSAGWQWVNGEGPFTFTNWSPGEPNNGAGAYVESYLVFWAEGANRRTSMWNDVAGTLPFMSPAGKSYLVEFTTRPVSPQPVPEPSTLVSAALGLAGYTGWRRRLRRPVVEEG